MSTLYNMQVVVLIGGLGTRLKGIASGIPKSMANVHGYPFFYYQLKLMKWYGLSEFILCTGYKRDIVRDFFGDGSNFGVHIEYSSDGDKPLGTGGALRKALPLLKEDFLVVYGDSFMDADYSELMYHFYRAKSVENKKALMAVFKNMNKYDKSNVIFKNNRILMYDKKKTLPEMEYIDYGISILNRSVIEKLPQDVIDLADVFQALIVDGLMAGFEVRNRFYEIGAPESIVEFREFIYRRVFVKKKAILLDRDGTINEIVYNEDVEQFDSPLKREELKLLPRTLEALNILKSSGYLLIVITNQPAAAKGKTALLDLYEINNRLRDLLKDNNIYVDDIIMCPHHPTGSSYCREAFLIRDCDCRKPRPGLILKAIEKFNVDTDRSYIVGDSYVDVLAGKAAGLKSVFLGKYKCDTCRFLDGQKPDHIFENLHDFACHLKGEERDEKD